MTMSSSSARRRSSPLPAPPTLGDWLSEAPFRLVLSSGFFGFYAHCGTLLALEEAGHVPAALAGSSAGALVSGAWAAGVAPEALRQELLRLRRQDFWDPGPGLGFLQGKAFRAKLEAILPVARFEQCRAPLSLSVYDVLGRRTRPLAEGPLAPAIHASCAVPLMFQPVWIAGRPLLDGGVLDRAGLWGLPQGERVFLHYLSSRSPWRLAQPEPPSRPGLVSLEIGGLPRVSPFRLDQGQRALEHAYQATRAALATPVTGGRLRI